jgi:nucleotidyltransferase substrate binding protein (TIGR01987 family)
VIDLSPMTAAVATLTESLALVEEARATLSIPMQLIVQRGLIQAFEYNYVMAIGMLERYLAETSAVPDKRDLGNFQELIRVADEQGLIQLPFARWKVFRLARNLTSHTYNQDKALAVESIVPEFEREVLFLLSQLQERLA